jgi:hypothetical protein
MEGDICYVAAQELKTMSRELIFCKVQLNFAAVKSFRFISQKQGN